jgi:GNAT superfamily N-acetyltransferase
VVEVVAGRSDSAAVERLLRALPDWFGIESAIVEYVRDAHTKPTYLALDESGEVVGAILLTRHNVHAAEVHLMAVIPDRHRRGIGRTLLRRVEGDLRADGVRLLEVKTLGPSMADDGYERTRAFYESVGFLPLEEIEGLWPGNPCLIMVKPLDAPT